ncbi:hypothetical protein AVEN_167469-1 [Araneus ventricosus]|uniref:Uncharacterized protein n=1 Tax=Araneus ventricosus TaxID=182803 RepID=A0A4Y2ICF2_ARAVE|nr:hypothetical protein AVEN_167469-1 [Araneus ventricosus]
MLPICMLGLIHRLFCPGCRLLPEAGNRSYSIGLQRFIIYFPIIDDSMFLPRRIQLILAPEAYRPKTFLIVVYAGRDLLGYQPKITGRNNQL